LEIISKTIPMVYHAPPKKIYNQLIIVKQNGLKNRNGKNANLSMRSVQMGHKRDLEMTSRTWSTIGHRPK
jgi:hypothetical protein